MKSVDRNEKNFIVQMDDLMPVIREQLAAGQAVRFTPTGVSMMPLLRHGRDNVILSPVPDVLKVYDLVLYQRENGDYVLHRIVEAGDTYTCMGDNQFVKERGLTHEQMIGLVREFYRGSKKVSVDQSSYKIYCRVWYHSRRFRHFCRRAAGKLRRCFR